MGVFRCYTEKREGFDVGAAALLADLRGFLGMTGIEALRLLCRYDVEGIPESVYTAARETVFSEPAVDLIYDEDYSRDGRESYSLAVEPLPGQYDQRADSCSRCIGLLSQAPAPPVRTATLYLFYGDVGDADQARLRDYLINPLESREADIAKPDTLGLAYMEPQPVETLQGFTAASSDELGRYLSDFGLAMDLSDAAMMQAYFRDEEERDPTLTELRVIDTYWSDHCRHTTFNTRLTDISIGEPAVEDAYRKYLQARLEVYGNDADERPITFMDIATIAAKLLRRRGLLQNLDLSDEINACSFHVDASVGGVTEDWLIMFKNETHNHPTEVEPYGGAATCIGGAIRDPLAGRAYVYQAMRVTGSGDPRAPIGDTIPGKIPQRKLTTTAARGYSSYGNQIGVPTGLVHEFYHQGYIAKRLELGAVVGAARACDVVREAPSPGDKVVLIGGRTGRDGIGGATGSSKTHTTRTIGEMSAEVQKGNAPEERKLQRLFLDSEVTRLIKKCNDFGAGGVSVAIGELADGVDVDLSQIRLKYEGLGATETAISESQERMAVVASPEDAQTLIKKAAAENLEATIVAGITGTKRMVMRFAGAVVADISREFLSTNGAVKYAPVRVAAKKSAFYATPQDYAAAAPAAAVASTSVTSVTTAAAAVGNCAPGGAALSPAAALRALVRDLRYCSQRGLYEMFDGTVGASSVLMKCGGLTQSTPVQAMASLLPAAGAETCTVMSFGFDPYLSSADPFEGARAAVINSVAKLVAVGCSPDLVYLSLQEYFGRLGDNPEKWGMPFRALLGAFTAQMDLEVAAIGGKDSMSGTYGEMDVPPTLVSFAIAPCEAGAVISPEFKEAGHDIVLVTPSPNLPKTKETWREINSSIAGGEIVSAWAVTQGGVLEGLFNMSLGNGIGFEADAGVGPDSVLTCAPGTIIAELARPAGIAAHGAVVIGRTIADPVFKLWGENLSISELKADWEQALEEVFPTEAATGAPGLAFVPKITCIERPAIVAGEKFAKPRALILAFPGTNCEIDTARAVDRAGGISRIIVVRDLTPAVLEQSIAETAKAIAESQILIIPGGFSFGDEPDGSAKFITVFFRSGAVTDAVHEHLKSRDGLILGICNGFQALIKLGLVPFGEIVPPSPSNPTLSNNRIGRHQARYVYTRVSSVKSPWMSLSNVGDIHALPVSHGEGRFTASAEMIDRLSRQGLVATQYTDHEGAPSLRVSVNPNGSDMAIEGLFSPDGRVFGKMAHSERAGRFVAINIEGEKHQPIFESGINYFA